MREQPMPVARSRWIPDLSHRDASAELMDDMAADEGALFTTLRDFKSINVWVTHIRHLFATTIIADMKRRKMRYVTLLDIASGGCDTGLWFARYCRSRGIACTVLCLDYDPRVLRYARSACSHEPAITFIEADARDIASLKLKVDYAFANHFLHHLPDKDIPGLLCAISNCARNGFVLHDLDRHIGWYLGFTLLSGILWRNGYTFSDGRMSIRRGFKRSELEHHVERAGINVSIGRSGLGHWRITDIPTHGAKAATSNYTREKDKTHLEEQPEPMLTLLPWSEVSP